MFLVGSNRGFRLAGHRFAVSHRLSDSCMLGCQGLSVFCQSLPPCSLEGVCGPNESSKQTGTRIGLRVHPQLVEKKLPCCSYMLPGDCLSSEIVGFVGRVAQGKHPLRE